MRHPPRHIFEHDPDSLGEWCQERGLKPFRAAQILEWVYAKKTADPAAMTNLSAADRRTLAGGMTFLSGSTVRHQLATDGTQKLLIEWDEFGDGGHRARESSGGGAGDEVGGLLSAGTRSVPLTVMGSATGDEDRHAAPGWTDAPRRSSRDPATGKKDRHGVSGYPGEEVEARRGASLHPETEDRRGASVHPKAEDRHGVAGYAGDPDRQTECVMIPSLDPSGPRRTACISSQVGCPVGCKFCASGLGGLAGNLSAGRIVEQVWRLGTLPDVKRITHVVFMGMGEPLSNFGPVVKAIRTLTALWGMGISARRITVSTVGLPKAIERLAEQLDLPVTLALSLHAPNDELRRQLIPWAEYTTIADLLAACRKWFEKTGREITLEYTLLRGVNDRPEHATELAQVARSLRANVNIIRYNEVAGLPFNRPRSDDVQEFQRILRARQVNAHIRRSRGRDIAAACGQLRHEAATR